jgi:hypothetical protein
MNADRDRALHEQLRRNPFWVCLLVFGVLAVDSGMRFSRLIAQRQQLSQMEIAQATTIGQMSDALAQLPTVEAKLQALSVDLLRMAGTNAAAARIAREFSIQWTPGKSNASTTNAAGTNAAVNP